MTTKEQLSRALQIVQAIGAAIMEAKEIPSGHLYAMLCDRISLQEYEGAVSLLKRKGIVTESAHVLKWSAA